MFPFFSLLLISQIITTYGDLSEEKKYISDLKEAKKKEFIDRVVRRLAQEVDLKDIPTEENKNITSEQLDIHNNFVKKIINEEKANFDIVRDDVENKTVTLEPRRLSNKSHIDFTLKEQSRIKRHENSDIHNNTETTEVNEVTIPVRTVYDEDLSKDSERNFNKSLTVGKDDIQVKGHRLKSRRSTQKVENVELKNNSTSENSKNFDNSNIYNIDKSKESNEETSSVTESSDEITPSEATLENNYESTTNEAANIENKITSKNLHESHVETSTIDNGEYSDQNKDLRDPKQDTKSSNEDYSKESANATINPQAKVSDLTSNDNVDTTLPTNTVDKENLQNITEKQAQRDESLEQSTAQPKAKLREFDLNTHHTTKLMETTTLKVPKTLHHLNNTVESIERNRINDLTLSYNPYKTEHSDTDTILRSEKINIVKVGPSNKTILRSKLPTEETENILNPNPTEVNDELRTLQIAEEVVKALKMEIEKDTMSKKLAFSKKPNLIKKKVHIYGLQTLDEEKSIEKKENNKEEPYYAPVYNYDPNNAYYNAYNKFGPNDEDSKAYTNELQETDKLKHLQNDPSDKYSRSFFKKPLKFSDKVPIRKPMLKKVFIDRFLPLIVKKPYKVPQNDYEELLEEKDYCRYGDEIKEADESLKNHLRHIRKDRLPGAKRYKQQSRNEEDNRGMGWVDESVKYYIDNLKNGAHPLKTQDNYQSINYDYIGDYRFDETKKLRNELSFMASAKPVKASREVITRIEKVKHSDSKEIIEKFQKVYPLLKNLVKIIDDDVDEEIEACVKVMKDMINRNDEGLEQYDWLESTVNIKSAIRKLQDLTRAATEGLIMHPSDVELLKFTTYLFALASEDLKKEVKSFPSLRAKSPKSGRTKGHFVNHKRILAESSSRKYLKKAPTSKNRYEFEYGGLRRFLNELSDSLFDLHNALKHISSVTSFKSQRWYKNLKDLYLHDLDRKKLLQVILHLGTTRLFNLIEDASKNGVEEDVRRYLLENQTMVSKVKEAFVFVLKVLQAAMYSR